MTSAETLFAKSYDALTAQSGIERQRLLDSGVPNRSPELRQRMKEWADARSGEIERLRELAQESKNSRIPNSRV